MSVKSNTAGFFGNEPEELTRLKREKTEAIEMIKKAMDKTVEERQKAFNKDEVIFKRGYEQGLNEALLILEGRK